MLEERDTNHTGFLPIDDEVGKVFQTDAPKHRALLIERKPGGSGLEGGEAEAQRRLKTIGEIQAAFRLIIGDGLVDGARKRVDGHAARRGPEPAIAGGG